MYPDLSYLLHDIFGTKPDNLASVVKIFGVFMALAFFVSGYILFLELRRRHNLGLIGLVTTKINRQTKQIRPELKTADIAFVAAITGLLGAKIFAFFESSRALHSFLADPFGSFFSGSGLAMYGGLIGGFLGVVWYIRKLGIPFLQMADAVSPALIVGYATGRIGCQLAGDGDWGIDNLATAPNWWFLPKWTWSFDYPRNVLNEGIPIENCMSYYCRHLEHPVWPTPFYETVFALVIGLILWSLRKRLKIAGLLACVYLFLNGFERYFIEKIRINDKINAFGINFTQAELIAFILMLIGLIGGIYLWRNGKEAEVIYHPEPVKE